MLDQCSNSGCATIESGTDALERETLKKLLVTNTHSKCQMCVITLLQSAGTCGSVTDCIQVAKKAYDNELRASNRESQRVRDIPNGKVKRAAKWKKHKSKGRWLHLVNKAPKKVKKKILK